MAVGLVFVALVVGAVPAQAKGPQPSDLRAPATATAGEVITNRARIKGIAPGPDGLASSVAEPLQFRRVTRRRPLAWIGQDVVTVTFVHVRGDRYRARLKAPSEPGRYLFHTERFRLWELNQASSAERARVPWLVVRARELLPSPNS